MILQVREFRPSEIRTVANPTPIPKTSRVGIALAG
jgi:hypothetical protein